MTDYAMTPPERAPGIYRRTFAALQFPKGSPERRSLNCDAVTSEYMPSYRWTVIGAHSATSYRTRAHAEAAAEADAEHRQDGQDELDRETAERDWNRALGDGRN